MHTLKDVQKIIKGLDMITGLNGSELELKQTKNVRTLASFTHRTVKWGGRVARREPVRFEFSTLVLSCDYKTLEEIVKHEYAHYMALVTFNENCNHDWRFKQMCAQIGASANEPSFSNKSIMSASAKLAKYTATCTSCGYIYTFSRKCSTLDACRVGAATCSCGSDKFAVKQNR